MPLYEQTVKLYRPVGPKELELIEQSGYSCFPPRLPEQPIFYPVTNEAYASRISKEWNVPAYCSGYVTEFEVRKNFLKNYPVQNVGGENIDEYWIPSEELGIFNKNIVGKIKVIRKFH